MFKKPNCPVIAVEEHYWDAELAKTYIGLESGRPGPQMERLFDLGALRIKEMDEAGIDMQVISHGAPSAQKLPADGAAALVRGVNDRLAAACAANPKRFAAFAALPSNDPKAAADELERTVTKHRLQGRHDARAVRRRVPRRQAVLADLRARRAARRADLLSSGDAGCRAWWRSTTTTTPRTSRWWCARPGATRSRPRPPRSAWCCPACSTSIRSSRSILGHLGETLPFLVWRVDHAIARPGAAKSISFRDIFCNNFWITTSGNFSNPALMCCVQEMGVDRILFAVDWPFVVNPPGVDWMKTVPLCDEDKAKILSGNAKRLLRM